MTNICVPVLTRYDLLHDMLTSLTSSTVKVDKVHIIDNGRDAVKLHAAIKDLFGSFAISIMVPPKPMGVAESWNWFIQHIPEERVITNDDVIFAPDSLARLTMPDADLIWAKACGFSCFVLRDSCVAKLGLFDETISPGYGYYEDEDYLQRLDGRGTRAASAVAAEVDADVTHLKSQTLASFTRAELNEHHRKFKLAQGNYAQKWHLEDAFR